jgi:hypothetical protein
MSDANSALRIDADYRNTGDWQKSDDQFNKFFRFEDGKGINNASGFRPKSRLGGSTDIIECAFCVVVTNLEEAEWPDSLDLESGLFTYYGDNRKPGTAVDETIIGGNRLLQYVFERVHSGNRASVPPFLCFQSVKTDRGTFMRFLGLAAPGAASLSSLDDLVSVWRFKSGRRFQNHRAIFTILREEQIPKTWLVDLVRGTAPAESASCPANWQHWVKTGLYAPLVCRQQAQPRSKTEQLPVTASEWSILKAISSELSDREFEFAASELVRLLDPRFTDMTVTQRVRDGGRDVLGSYIVGHAGHSVRLSVAVEAKQWNPASAVGVKPMMRLISRLKHRDVGVFVTTSFFDRQVQSELIEDQHPVLLMSGGDIAKLIIARELGGDLALSQWLESVRIRAAQQI